MNFIGYEPFTKYYRLYLTLLSICYCLQSFANCSINTLDNQHIVKTNQIEFVDYQHSLDNSCWIKGSQIVALSEIETPLWIDVRSKIDQELLTLTGLLTIPLHTLASKQFLQQQTVILVGTGFDQVVLNKACIQLKKTGFKTIYALEGGAYVINQKHQQHYGITPEQYWLGSMASSWKTITIDITENELQSLPTKPFKQLKSATDNISSVIQQTLSQLTESLPISLVIITKDQTANRYWQQLLKPLATTKKIVWLQGGIQNYKDYIQQQKNIRNNAGEATIRPCS